MKIYISNSNFQFHFVYLRLKSVYWIYTPPSNNIKHAQKQQHKETHAGEQATRDGCKVNEEDDGSLSLETDQLYEHSQKLVTHVINWEL